PDCRHRGIPDGHRRVPVAAHPANRTVWVVAEVQQIEHAEHFERRTLERHAVKRPEGADLPAWAHDRATMCAGRTRAWPQAAVQVNAHLVLIGVDVIREA